MAGELKKVDHQALRANQITVIVLNIVGFVLNTWWFAAASAFFFLVGTAIGKPGFLFLYKYILKPLGVKPQVYDDNPEPHRFAQGFGTVVLILGAVFLAAGYDLAGWIFVWLVVVLAALNAFLGFCAGCFVYYQLAKVKFPGFKKLPPEGSVAGFKPKASA